LSIPRLIQDLPPRGTGPVLIAPDQLSSERLPGKDLFEERSNSGCYDVVLRCRRCSNQISIRPCTAPTTAPAATTKSSSTSATGQVIPSAGMKLVPMKTTTIPSSQAAALARIHQPAF